MREREKCTSWVCWSALSPRASFPALKRVPNEAFPSLATAIDVLVCKSNELKVVKLTLVCLLGCLSSTSLDGLSNVVGGVPVTCC